jgi:tRNA(His) 5'-end guanylyltransferase
MHCTQCTLNIQLPSNALSYTYRYRLKAIESQFDQQVPSHLPFIIRLDGVSFSKFTKGINKPFDHRLVRSFQQTTEDLVAKFLPATGYCQSDEISLVFPSAFVNGDGATKKEHMYKGRSQKLTSVIASYASVRFNYHLTQQNWEGLPLKVQQRMIGHEAYFDGRVIVFDSTEEVADCIFWRSNCDGLRNAISHIALHHFTAKELHGQSIVKQLENLHKIKGINVMQEYGLETLFGTWFKKEQYEISIPPEHLKFKKRKSDETTTMRTRVAKGSFNWADWSSSQRTEFILSKYWGDNLTFPPKTLT